MADNNNLDLSTITGTGPNTQKTKDETAEAVKKAAEGVAAATGDAPKFTLPEGYDPALDPRVKTMRDSLFSQNASLQEQLKNQKEAAEKHASELAVIKDAQEKERLAKLSDSEKVTDQLRKLAETNQELLKTVAEMKKQQADSEFESVKSRALAESGIPAEFHRFIGAGARDFTAFQQELEVAKTTFKDVIKKSDVPTALKTTNMGTNPPPSNQQVNPPAPTPQGRLIDRLDPETAGKINFDTLPEIIRKNPKFQDVLKKSFGR